MKTCKIETCKNKFSSLGYCNKHYKRFKTYGDPHFVKLKVKRAKDKKIIIRGEIAEIELTKGKVAIIDKEDVDKIKNHSWCAVAGKHGTFYAESRINTKIMRIQWIIKGKWYDHINNDPLDNRKENLRKCTVLQNNRNQSPLSATSKYKGVCKKRGRKNWSVAIGFNYKQIYIGSFKTEKEGAVAYDKKALELYGKFAWLNKDNFKQDFS